jgi:hypothetical protein
VRLVGEGKLPAPKATTCSCVIPWRGTVVMLWARLIRRLTKLGSKRANLPQRVLASRRINL